eukprot:TRINITY_DN16341_c0_g1_i1.p2 TRINITY_DN16341_c0_g1~~TRINITY_DN16341_c0_g1_i1.p2  ORF type:complete len:101 (-),score=7.57 TRINITY_DN16341_c0_g1_i1:98-400(-)
MATAVGCFQGLYIPIISNSVRAFIIIFTLHTLVNLHVEVCISCRTNVDIFRLIIIFFQHFSLLNRHSLFSTMEFCFSQKSKNIHIASKWQISNLIIKMTE